MGTGEANNDARARGFRWFGSRLYVRFAAMAAVVGALLLAVPFPHAVVPCRSGVGNPQHLIVFIYPGDPNCTDLIATSHPPSILFIILSVIVLAVWLKRKLNRAKDAA